MESAHLNELVEILNQEVDLLLRLHSTLCAQQQALVEDRVDRVTSSVEEQIEILNLIGQIEERRRSILASYSGEDEVENIKIDNLIDSAPDHLASRLSAIKKALKEVIDAIGKVNTQNGMLINQSLSYINNTIRLVAGEDQGSAVYTQDGDLTCATGHIAINRTI